MSYSFVFVIEVFTVFIVYLMHYLLKLFAQNLQSQVIVVIHQHISIKLVIHTLHIIFQKLYEISLVYTLFEYVFLIISSCYYMIYSTLVFFSPFPSQNNTPPDIILSESVLNVNIFLNMFLCSVPGTQ